MENWLYLAINKSISGCVHIACFGLMITSLLQVVNRLEESWLSRLFIHKLVVSTTRTKSVNIKLQQGWFSDLLLLDEVNRLNVNLKQAGKIHKLQQVCGVTSSNRVAIISVCRKYLRDSERLQLASKVLHGDEYSQSFWCYSEWTSTPGRLKYTQPKWDLNLPPLEYYLLAHFDYAICRNCKSSFFDINVIS